MAYTLSETRIKDDEFLVIEDEPLINLFDRWELGHEREDTQAVLFPDGMGGQLSSEADFSPLFDQFTIDRAKLTARIDTLLKNRVQVTLKEIVDTYGLQNGLSEVVGYFSIASSSSHHIILETIEPLWIGKRKINVPMIIYTKPNN
jgi:hypothetical protein